MSINETVIHADLKSFKITGGLMVLNIVVAYKHSDDWNYDLEYINIPNWTKWINALS